MEKHRNLEYGSDTCDITLILYQKGRDNNQTVLLFYEITPFIKLKC